jgi:hypothetical protein
VKVRIVDLNAETMTDEDGAFAFTDVAPGPHTIELSSRDLVTIKTEEVITKGKKKTVKYMVEPKEDDVDEEAVVRAPRIKKEVVETRVRTEEAKRVPGTQGDTLKVVQNLPGVGRSAFGSGALIVWGSAPQDTRVNVDGVEIPMLYHVGGMRSTINADLVRSIDLSPGSFGAEYGRGLGGLVRIELQDPGEGVHGYVASDVVDVSGMVKAAITPNLRISVSGRYGYLDKSLKAVVSKDVGDFFPIPRYDDYQARATLTLGKDEEVSATFLASDDHLRRAVPSSDPLEIKTQDTDQSYRRFIVRYTHLLPDGSSVMFAPSFGWDQNNSAWNFGGTPLLLNISTWQYGVRGSYRRRVGKHVVLSLGMDFQGRSSTTDRVGSLNLPAREGDITVFGQPPGSDLGSDHWKVNLLSAAPYAFSEISLGRLTITPGFRLEPTVIDGNLELPHSYVKPDVGYRRIDLPRNPLPGPLAWMPNPSISPPIGRHPSSIDGRRGRLRTTAGCRGFEPGIRKPALESSSAVHVSGGGSYKLTGTLNLELIGFYKKLYDLVARSEAPSPHRWVSHWSAIRDRARYGGQVLLRQELAKGFFGWFTYSLIRSERKDSPDQSGACSTTTKRTCLRCWRATRSRTDFRRALASATRRARRGRLCSARSSTPKTKSTSPSTASTIRSACRRSIHLTCASRNRSSIGA